MSDLRTAAQMALDWFEWLHSGQPDHMAGIDTDGVRQSLRAALAEPAEQQWCACEPTECKGVGRCRWQEMGYSPFDKQPVEQEPVAEEIDRLVLDRPRHRRIHAAIQGHTSHQGRDLEQYMNITELAKQAGLFTHKEVQPEIKRFAALVRAAALEEAAGVCELRSHRNDDMGAICAAAIRALKEQA